MIMIYTVHIYYSKHGTLDVEHFETQSNYSYDKGMTAKRKPLPPIPPPTKAR